ncbi:Threonine/homoserine/homoserine lactone efflux protein [Lampropedia hyalina DSM 16112]|uniref:Threonine/homoserine/homoserine lactone efflux protein n=1 Tax=Lampropedia hyalina DSM 16112 TaxID=1122156 RepID=A0A1M4XJD7_9BURK|nr:LysE family translocator [Lampropedia hyalina]SHE93664.1 Threonine/homoserine/homoserine lactone efflux protein [Lampropedia hyalina DSM 16112]
MSSTSLLVPLALFAFASSITPGPNNIMLASSGLNHGFRRSVPHMLGISVGFMLMLVVIGLGLGALFRTWPALHQILKIASALYLLYLAWRIATASPVNVDARPRRPFSFWEAAFFQWINPKAWTMALGVIAVYVPQTDFLFNLLLGALICGLVNLPSISVWTLFGVALRRYLRQPAVVRAFNIGMALLLVASLVPLVWP